MYKFAQILSMSPRLLALLVLILCLGCVTQNSRQYPLLNYIPEETTLIARVNNLNTFKSELKNNNFLNDAGSSETIKRIKNIFQVLDGIESDTTNLIALVERDRAHMVFLTYAHQGWHIVDDSTAVQDSISANIFTTQIKDVPIYTMVSNGIRILSTSEEIIRQLSSDGGSRKNDPLLQSLYKTASPQKSASLFVKTDQLSTVLPSFLGDAVAQKNIYPGQWIALDLNSNQQFLSLNGLVGVKDTTPNFLKLFKGTNPLQSVTPDLASPDTDAILSYTFDDYEVFAKNQQEYLDSPYSINTPFTTVEEIGIIFRNRGSAVVISTYSSEGIQTFLDNNTRERVDYQGHEIASLSKTDFLNEAFKPILENFNSSYYTILDNKYIFSSSESELQNLISNYNSKSNFAASSTYESARELLTNESTILFVANTQGIQRPGNKTLSSELLEVLLKPKSKSYAYSSQLVADSDYFHAHFSVNKVGGIQKSNTTTPLFTVLLDNDVATDPQFVINHRTNKKEIVVQDVENNLYLISAEGKVLWKKQLEAPIQGKIQQVDIYKNGRLQLAFTTSNQFIILDRNGKEVLPFNMSFPSAEIR